MRRNNLIRSIIAIALLIWAIYQLSPTYHLYHEKQEADQYISELTSYTGLETDEIKEALNSGTLELQLQESSLNADSLALAQQVATKLIAVHDRIAKHEPQSIKQGLDLQGGTYLVYEVNLPKLVLTNAKLRDAKLDSLVEQARVQSLTLNEDFFSVLKKLFAKENFRMSKYFGKRTQSDDEIIKDLNSLAEDAVDRTLEVIRNRVDRFGVSEPSITKQGSKRMVIELAGVDDVGRAKKIIGDTALLEFKLVKDNQTVSAVLQDIDKAWKRVLQGAASNGDTTGTSAKVKGRKAKGESELSDILGADVAGSDSSDSPAIDSDFAKDNPFFALLANLGNGAMGVPKENLLSVQRIIRHPDVIKVIPEDVQILFYAKPDIYDGKAYTRFEFLKKEPEITGKYLKKADVTLSTGRQSLTQGEPQVSLEFNNEGARIFSRITGANVGKRLAIVLDDKIASAPNISERIPYGQASIHGRFTMDEANELAIVLRAGALPAPVDPIEERTVGPSLGQDSVRRGQLSIGMGLLLVVLFMMLYYRWSGAVADIALFFNLVIILAVLAARSATLTLPGVAGIILTIGMAVDANVLIFERIREELRTGKTPRAAIDAGYSRAFWTIFDANVTTLLTALVLYQFGTGPIRGFALTLMIGIIASMFTAIVVTRIVFDYFTQKRNIAKLSI